MADRGTLDVDGFSANTMSLESPDFAIIERTYYALPARGSVVAACRLDEAPAALRNFEAAGFFGMRLRRREATGEITAYKGKEGACLDTGRTARYTGSAAAVLDDDNHFLAGELRVCQKTSEVYASPAYADVMTVSDGDAALLERLDAEPKPFDCDTFEADAARVASSLTKKELATDASVEAMYPGPFKLIVLDDGRILRRGQVVNLDAATAQALEKNDGCILFARAQSEAAPLPVNFIDEYTRSGPIFILSDGPAAEAVRGSVTARMEVLMRTPAGTLDRLRKMIKRRDPYFLLTGSDPSDPEGCCPSDDVGAADALVRAGILESWRPATPPDACPTTTYAFSGEMAREGGRPMFSLNEVMRHEVLRMVEGND